MSSIATSPPKCSWSVSCAVAVHGVRHPADSGDVLVGRDRDGRGIDAPTG
jgi:hypothetical protein